MTQGSCSDPVRGPTWSLRVRCPTRLALAQGDAAPPSPLAGAKGPRQHLPAGWAVRAAGPRWSGGDSQPQGPGSRRDPPKPTPLHRPAAILERCPPHGGEWFTPRPPPPKTRWAFPAALAPPCGWTGAFPPPRGGGGSDTARPAPPAAAQWRVAAAPLHEGDGLLPPPPSRSTRWAIPATVHTRGALGWSGPLASRGGTRRGQNQGHGTSRPGSEAGNLRLPHGCPSVMSPPTVSQRCPIAASHSAPLLPRCCPTGRPIAAQRAAQSRPHGCPACRPVTTPSPPHRCPTNNPTAAPRPLTPSPLLPPQTQNHTTTPGNPVPFPRGRLTPSPTTRVGLARLRPALSQ